MTEEKSVVELSIVAPMYNEEAVIDIFFERVSQCLSNQDINYEIVCVNDAATIPRSTS